MNKLYLQGGVEKKASANGEDVYTIIASTGAIDRQGDSVDQRGWDLTNFNKNPVLLWAHDYAELPIGKVVSARVEKGKLIADFMFATQEANPKAQQIKRLYEEGIVNASSVGFIPLERNGNVITRSELLELSLVPVPANQEALRLALSKGFDADFIKSIEADIEKGAVADEISAEEMWEAKYENWREVMDIINAFGAVYFKEETGVAEFSALLSETADLLQNVADGIDVEGETKIAKMFGSEEVKGFVAPTEEKAGAVLSTKNKELINNAVASMEGGVTALKELLASVDGGEEKAVEVKEEVVDTTDAPVEGGSVEDTTVKLNVNDVMKDVQALLRANDKTNETVLGIVNRFIATKEAVTGK